MKKILVLGCLLMFAVGLFGQDATSKGNEGCVIRGVLDGVYKGKKVYLVEEEEINGASKVIDSCEVVDNRYTFNIKDVRVPKMYFVKSSDPESLSPITPVWVENGTVRVKANSEFFLNAEAKGTITNDIFGFYNALIKHLEDSSMRAFLLEKKLYGERDYEYENAEFKRRTAHGKQRNLDILKDMVKMYPDQVTAPFFIYWGMRYQLPLEELKVMRTAIDSKLNEHPYTKQLDEFIRLAEFNVGSTIPDFTLPDQNGKMVSVKDFRGKYVLIDFWASWCGPCRGEMKKLVPIYNELKGDDLEFISISLDSKEENWRKMLEEEKLPWVMLWDEEGFVIGNEPNKIQRAYGFYSIPFIVLIDKDGRLLAKDLRGERVKEEILKARANK